MAEDDKTVSNAPAADAASGQLLPTPSEFGHFLLEKELGHGGMGGVYLGRDRMLDRPVAIKVMLKSLGDDPAFVERFQREAQAAARLNHPNIAQIYSFGQENGMPYIAMELVDGGSLDKEMAESPGKLDPAYVMNIGMQMAEALNLAAQNGLVHGDVKPENILFDKEGNAKLVDFGLAAMQGDSNEIWGTPYYISPEKVRKQKIDHRADIYSLGGTLYHALTGQPPYEGTDATAVVRARFDAPPRRPSEVRPGLPLELDDLLLRMLETEPAMRYPTWESMMGDLRRYLSKVGPIKKKTQQVGPRIRLKGKKIRLPSATAGDPASLESASLAKEEEEQHSSIGKIIGFTVGGVVLLIVLVVGGVFWYIHSEEKREKREHYELIVSKQQEARTAIAGSVKAIGEFGKNFHELAERARKDMKEASEKVRGMLTPEMLETLGGDIVPPPTKEIDDAKAYVAKLKAAAEKPAAADEAKPAAAEEAKPAAPAAEEAKPADAKGADGAKPAATPEQIEAFAKRILAKIKDPSGESLDPASPEYADALAKMKASPEFAMIAQMAATNPKLIDVAVQAAGDPAAMQEAMKKMSGGNVAVQIKVQQQEASAAKEKKPVEIPQSVKQFIELWNDAYYCQAADIRVQARIELLLLESEKEKDLTAEDIPTAEALGALSHSLVETLAEIKSMKCVEQTQRKAGVIKNRTVSLTRSISDQLSRLKAKAMKEAAAKAKAEAQAAAEVKAAEEHKQKVEEETKIAVDKFTSLSSSLIRQLSWDLAIKQMKDLDEELTTPEGKEALKMQIEKVEYMAALQRHFIKHSKGVKFYKGHTTIEIVSADAKNLMFKTTTTNVKGVVKDGPKYKLTWNQFYTKNRGQLNRLIIEIVEKGRTTCRTPLREWSQLMLGAAMTMQTLYAEDPTVPKRVEGIVKKAIKTFEPCKKHAIMMFPEIQGLDAVSDDD